MLSEIRNGSSLPPYKRNRGPEWPLKSTEEHNPYRVTYTKQRKKSLSPGQKRDMPVRNRISKFVEGSMNDRISAKPPSLYTRDEQVMKDYHDQEEGRTQVLDHQAVHHDTRVDKHKPSGMHRFGKALFSAFNPVNVWQGFNGIWKDKEGRADSQKALLEERRTKAEMAYAELKKSGYKGTNESWLRTMRTEPSDIEYNNAKDQGQETLMRDSGIDMDEDVTYGDFLVRTKPKQNTMSLLAPPSERLRTAVSPASELSGGRKSSLNLRRPSFTSLKKVKSHVQLPTTKRQTNQDFDLGCEKSMNHDLRKQPSRKDIAKQQKLSKRVSDLETKLDLARRELKLSLQGVPDAPEVSKPARKSFKPGALSSLPSESIINAEKILGQDIDTEARNFPNLEASSMELPLEKLSAENAFIDTSQTEMQSPSEERHKHQGNLARKRKSSSRLDKNYHPTGTATDSESDHSTLRRSKRQRKRRISLDMNTSNIKTSKSKEALTSHPRLPKTVKGEHEETVPPVSSMNSAIDLAMVDKKRLTAMRSTPNDSAPSSHVPEDTVDLQEEVPAAPDVQLSDHIAKLSEENQTTEKTSRANGSHFVSPTLERLCSTSPGKKDLQADSAITEPVLFKLGSSTLVSENLKRVCEDVTSNQIKPPEAAAAPKSQQKAENKKVKRTYSKRQLAEKPLPPLQKEHYDWDPDVF